MALDARHYPNPAVSDACTGLVKAFLSALVPRRDPGAVSWPQQIEVGSSLSCRRLLHGGLARILPVELKTTVLTTHPNQPWAPEPQIKLHSGPNSLFVILLDPQCLPGINGTSL